MCFVWRVTVFWELLFFIFFYLGSYFFLLLLLPLLLLPLPLPLLLLLLLPCFLASVLHWSFFLFLHLFPSNCCLVASCEFFTAFAACVVIFFLQFLFQQIKKAPMPLNARHQKFYERQKYINIRAQEIMNLRAQNF